MKHLFSLLGGGLLLALSGTALAQTPGVGIGTTAPHSSAALEVSSTAKGLLPPRLTQAQRDAIAAPAAGLTIYNTDTKRVNVWDGTAWVSQLTATEQPLLVAGPAQTFNYTGGPQTYTVPAGVTQITVTAAGSGGQNYWNNPGSPGGTITATLTVVPGEVLTVRVGSTGYNGGGSSNGAGRGGGATDLLRTGPSTGDYLASRNALLVAGGGGGTGANGGNRNVAPAYQGGPGGSPAGGTASAPGAGGGATQAGPGAGIDNNSGSNGDGGGGTGSSTYAGGGGGGGYYGGGGGRRGAIFSTYYGAPGGGGSSWVMPTGSSNITYGTAASPATDGSLSITPVPALTYAAPALDGANFVNLPNTATASNGLTKTGNDIALGGTLTQNTTLATAGHSLSLTGTGSLGVGTAAPTSTLDVQGSQALAYTTASADLTLGSAHHTVRRFGGCSTLTLPAASTCPGRVYVLINSNGTGSSVALAPANSVYDDVTNANLNSLAPNERISIQSDGSAWLVIGR